MPNNNNKLTDTPYENLEKSHNIYKNLSKIFGVCAAVPTILSAYQSVAIVYELPAVNLGGGSLNSFILMAGSAALVSSAAIVFASKNYSILSELYKRDKARNRFPSHSIG